MHTAAGPLKWRILCVDDDPDILTVLRMALSTKYEVVGALSGIEALKILRVAEPDFVICDIRMPGLDGFATVEQIRTISPFDQIPVFFLTAETSRQSARRGFDVGCNLYLTKPFEPMRLLDNIDYFTRESGHTVRAKSHSLADLSDLLEAARRAPAPAVVPVPASAPAPKPAPAPRVKAPKPEEYLSKNLQSEHNDFLAERKARERAFWKKRYAEIQRFIDTHSQG